MRLILAAILALALGGCGNRTTEHTVTLANGAKAKIVQTVVDGKTKTTVSTSGGRWPTALATVAPPYPGASITRSLELNPEWGGLITFTTPDSSASVADFYRKSAIAGGFGKARVLDVDGGKSLESNEVKSGRQISVEARPKGGLTAVLISYHYFENRGGGGN